MAFESGVSPWLICKDCGRLRLAFRPRRVEALGKTFRRSRGGTGSHAGQEALDYGALCWQWSTGCGRLGKLFVDERIGNLLYEVHRCMVLGVSDADLLTRSISPKCSWRHDCMGVLSLHSVFSIGCKSSVCHPLPNAEDLLSSVQP